MRIYFFILCTIILCGCNFNSHYEIRTPRPIDYAVKQKSFFFNEKNIDFHLDSLNNELYVKLLLKGFKNFPFPINEKFNDTLRKTAFRFEFYYYNKIIQSEYNGFRNTFKYVHDSSKNVINLILVSDTVDLRKEDIVEIKLPFYAFHSLPKGKQKIVLKIFQTNFTDELYVKDSTRSSNYVHLYSSVKLLNAVVSFDLNIPHIYKTIIFGHGLTLQSDAAWSPFGMDNTIWKSSYPDIYWTVMYPKNEFYVQTDFETSTIQYFASDTFNLYHYYLNDSVGFGVYDHDNLSRDDWMGDWWGSLNNLQKRSYNRLSFAHVKDFAVEIKN